MENPIKSSVEPLGWRKSFLWLALAVACFHLAYTSLKFPLAGLFIIGYAWGLVQITNQPSVRRAFYFGLTTAYLCYGPQLFFMWRIFGPCAIVLWLVLAFWVGLFAAIICGCHRRWGNANAAWLIPVVWMGIEYFRTELYYLKFSWLNIGYALPFSNFGMYGSGFLIFAIVTVLLFYRPWVPALFSRKITWAGIILIGLLSWLLAALLLPMLASTQASGRKPLSIVGVQLEFPPEHILSKMLGLALAKNPDAQIFVLSEYTLEGGVPDALKNWCRDHSRYLVLGGRNVITNDVYYNTAFVIGTNGEVVFQQVKSVPIQFFHDGLPAPNQEVWSSPWGKIGICICYDLSYTRVTDALIKQGAQLLIVPTMDVEYWGRHQHEVHARIAPVRAAEYGVPIFRLASSGISQAVSRDGEVMARTRFAGNGDFLAAKLNLPMRGRLPVDRSVAPVCVGISTVILASLLILHFKERRAMKQMGSK
jgi:apolipoprotein N-acyltransferase